MQRKFLKRETYSVLAVVVCMMVSVVCSSHVRVVSAASAVRNVFLQDSLVSVRKSLQSDTTQVTDSLSVVVDSLTAVDSMLMADIVPDIDSISVADTSVTADSTLFSMTERERKRMLRDSLKTIRDSIRLAKPRILETGFVPDSMYFKRIIAWNTGPVANEFNPVDMDTTFNDWYTEYPFMKDDVNVTYLGTAGSAVQNINFMKRREYYRFKAFSPYLVYSQTPETMMFLNTKTPYTELAYWGTLFDYKDKEEINVRFLHSQNITPALNLTLLIQKWDAKGILVNEATKNNNLHFNVNYLGKRYVAHAGYIRQNIDRKENGGIQDSGLIRDTTVDAKTIPVNLSDASNALLRNTVFINHSYTLPLYSMKKRQHKDSLSVVMSDSLAVPAHDSTAADSLSSRHILGDGPMLTFGHTGEFSSMYRFYQDKISLTDDVGRSFYNNMFYINPVTSADSTRVLTVENKFFFDLQPWARDAIVSGISGGIGHQWNNIYGFNPNMFLQGNSNIYQNNLYVYAGASGMFRKYLNWNARARYYFLGYNMNDFSFDGNLGFSFYPFKDKKEPVTLSGRFSTYLTEPDWFSQHYYSNHYIWNNSFGKTSITEAEAMLMIPKWKFELGFGYSLVNNYLYYGTDGIIRQHGGFVNVMNGYLKKDFKLWLFRFDNKVLFQYSSDKNVLPLPMLTMHMRYYLEFEAVKNVLTVQLGADATYNTLYYAPAYNPALGTFQLQTDELIGNNPYIDVFINLQWKNANIFLKCINVGQGWPQGDMFSAYHYIRPYRTFKFGIHWPFYYK